MKGKFTFLGEKYEKEQVILATCLLLPTIFFLVVLFILPVIKIIEMSFTNLNLATNMGEFIGLKNYKYLFTSKEFGLSLKNTFTFATIKLSLDVILAVTIASFLDSKIPLKRIFRSVYFAPVVVPVVASSLICVKDPVPS